MVASRDEIITKFHDQINMTVDELGPWLATDASHRAGTGVGHDSGLKILHILKKNPDKVRELYDEDDLRHMRKVVGYNSRHLAQEDHLKQTKTRDELAKTKSTMSLKNWGHDPLKTLDEQRVEPGRGEKHKREDSDQGPPASKRNRESAGDLEQGRRRPYSLPTRKSARHRTPVPRK